MEKNLILEINRIRGLMGIKPTLNEGPLFKFLKKGITEAAEELIKKIQGDIDLFKSGLLNEQELKESIKGNLDTLKYYVDESQLTTIKQNVDSIIQTNAAINQLDTILNGIKKEIDDIKEVMAKSKRDVNIEIDNYKQALGKRRQEQLTELYGANGQSSFLEGSRNATINYDWDTVISRFSNSDDFKDSLINSVKNFDTEFVNKITDNELKISTRKLLDATLDSRIELMFTYVEKLPSYKKKFLGQNIADDVIDGSTKPKVSIYELDTEYQRILKKNENNRTPSEQSFFEEYAIFKSTGADEIPSGLPLKYEASKKSASLEFKLKTNLVGSLGPEWLQGFKMLIESGFGMRKTASEWLNQVEITSQIIIDFMDKTTKDTNIKPNIESFKTEYNRLMSQLKNEMQLSVQGWDSASAFDFEGIWNKVKTQMLDSAKDETSKNLVKELIKKCETQNYGTGIVAMYPGYGGFKSIGDILEITKNNLEVTKGDSGWIGNMTVKLKTSWYEFKEVVKSTGAKEIFSTVQKRLKQIQKNKTFGGALFESIARTFQFLFYDLAKSTIRMFLTGTYANLELLITRLTSRGISRTSKSVLPQLATRLGAVYLSLYFLQEFLGPVNDLINYSYRALGEGLVDINFLWSKTLLKNAGLPIDFTDEDWIDFFMRFAEEFPPFKDLFKNGEVGKVIDFSNFIKILGSVIGLTRGGGTDKAVVEVDRLNGLIDAELKRINNDYLEKYERAKDLAINGKTEDERDMLRKMQNESAGDAVMYILKQPSINTVKYWKRNFASECSNFDVSDVDYIKKNTSFVPGIQPLIIKQLVDTQNKTVTNKMNDLYQKYKDEPERIAAEVANVYSEAKRVAEGQVSSNTGVVPLLTMPDGKKYVLFSSSDAYAYYWDPPYDDMITQLGLNKWEAKDGKVMLIKNDGKEFIIERKNLCNLFK
jgi:hypothetical protein